MCKKLINNRFKEVINCLIGNKIEPSKGNIAQKMGISPQKFTEILNGRMNVGTDLLAFIAKHYSFFSLHWLLLGEGSMLKNDENFNTENNTMLKNDENFNNGNIKDRGEPKCDDEVTNLIETINTQKKVIQLLEEKIEHLIKNLEEK